MCDNKRKIYVIVSLRVQGVHQWEECNLHDVKFLKFPHRHEFHIKATKEVSHGDRQVEIIRLKNQMLHFLHLEFGARSSANQLQFGGLSCEDIGDILVRQFALDSCEVLEDGENGALITK